MTYATGGESASPGDEPRPAEESQEKWEALVGELTERGHDALDRASERFRHNVKLARNGDYDLGAWLDDVKWFAEGVTGETSKLVEGLKNRTET